MSIDEKKDLLEQVFKNTENEPDFKKGVVLGFAKGLEMKYQCDQIEKGDADAKTER